MAKRFFYVCAGLFLLALSFELGSRTASAQAPSNPVVGVAGSGSNYFMAVTANGDTYTMSYGSGQQNWTRITNVFSNSPTAVQNTTWGQVKGTYRK